jgi:adenosylmethionine-8-amino-7-oxononanoate aminotransferase
MPRILRRRFYREALARELLLRPIGNTVYFMPPYILSDEEDAASSPATPPPRWKPP